MHLYKCVFSIGCLPTNRYSAWECCSTFRHSCKFWRLGWMHRLCCFSRIKSCTGTTDFQFTLSINQTFNLNESVVFSSIELDFFYFMFAELLRVVRWKCWLNLRMRPEQPQYSNGDEELVFFTPRWDCASVTLPSIWIVGNFKGYSNLFTSEKSNGIPSYITIL